MSSFKMAQFTDIDDLCLEKVLKYLKLIDLLNIADTNKRLKGVAELVFLHEHCKKMIDLDISTFLHTLGLYQCEFWYESQDNVCVLKATLQFLRCFGHLLTKFEIRHINNCSKSGLISRYVYKCCSESLVKIKFDELEESDFDDIDRSFSRVEDVEFSHCYIGKNLSQLHRWFPKMRRLNLICSEWAEPIYIVTHFPYLENLILSGYLEAKNVRNIAAALRLNPQLKRLELGPFFEDANFFQYIGMHLQNLESIKISWNLDSIYNLKNTEISFKNVKEFTLCLYGNSPLPTLPFSFEQLEGFTLKSGCKLNGHFIDFISKHPTIKLLSLNGFGELQAISNDIRIRIAETLPWLEKIYLNNYKMSVHEANQFLDKFESLKTFVFTLDDGTDQNRKHLIWFVGKQWKITWQSRQYTNPKVKLERHILNMNI